MLRGIFSFLTERRVTCALGAEEIFIDLFSIRKKNLNK